MNKIIITVSLVGFMVLKPLFLTPLKMSCYIDGRIGLTFLWKNDIGLKLKSFCKNRIDMEFLEGNLMSMRRFVFYGENETQLRVNSWNLLKQLANLPFFLGFVLAIFMNVIMKMKSVVKM